MCKSLHEPTDNNSNNINTTPSVSLPNNTPVVKTTMHIFFILSEGIGSLKQSFDTQIQNLTQMSPVKSSSKETNANNESDILIELLQDTIHILKKELINKENTINNLSIILKKITSNTYYVSPSNKESGNKLILENNTDHIDSKNEIVHELLDVKFEHLQRRYQHLLDQSPNQPEQTISNDQCINGSNVTKGCKVIESNIQNQELNKVTPPLNKIPSREEQLTDIR